MSTIDHNSLFNFSLIKGSDRRGQIYLLQNEIRNSNAGGNGIAIYRRRRRSRPVRHTIVKSVENPFSEHLGWREKDEEGEERRGKQISLNFNKFKLDFINS